VVILKHTLSTSTSFLPRFFSFLSFFSLVLNFFQALAHSSFSPRSPFPRCRVKHRSLAGHSSSPLHPGEVACTPRRPGRGKFCSHLAAGGRGKRCPAHPLPFLTEKRVVSLQMTGQGTNGSYVGLREDSFIGARGTFLWPEFGEW
jgi:hypothetical protein